MRSKHIIAGAALVASGLSAPALAAPILEPVPEANYITFGGNDWAWAAPCAPTEPSCGVIDLSYQGPLGWRLPTGDDFLTGPVAASFGTPGSFKCASAWFSTVHTHCDYGDGSSFYIYGHPSNPGVGYSTVETWLIRGDVDGAVPEPGTWAMMLLGFGIVGGALRARRRQRLTVSYA